jgi:hypothetical protein
MQSLPLGGGLLDALAHQVLAGVLDQPAAEGGPAAHQSIVGQLVGAAIVRLVGDQQPSAHERVERGARAGVSPGELRLAPPRARALHGDQADQHAAGRAGLRRRQ